MGKAIVSTSLGAEGLDYENGGEIVIADDPDTFASLVVSLLRDRRRRRSLGCAARSWVVRDHSFTALKSSMSVALGSVGVSCADRSQCRASA